MSEKYSMLIEWSEEDGVFVVSLSEWGPYAKTHGATYEEAATAGREAPDMLIESRKAEGGSLSEPRLLAGG